MNQLHNKNVRLAPWMGCTPARVEQTAYIEHAMEHARSWLWHGEKLMKNWRLERSAPHIFGQQAA